MHLCRLQASILAFSQAYLVGNLLSLFNLCPDPQERCQYLVLPVRDKLVPCRSPKGWVGQQRHRLPKGLQRAHVCICVLRPSHTSKGCAEAV